MIWKIENQLDFWTRKRGDVVVVDVVDVVEKMRLVDDVVAAVMW